MSGHGRHRGISRQHQHYSNLSQDVDDDDDQELNEIERGSRKPPEEKGGDPSTRARAEPTGAGLLHHHQRHPLRGGVRSDSDDPSSPGDFGYGAAHKDFRRHYKGSGNYTYIPVVVSANGYGLNQPHQTGIAPQPSALTAPASSKLTSHLWAKTPRTNSRGGMITTSNFCT
jgi:hypothetical protein